MATPAVTTVASACELEIVFVSMSVWRMLSAKINAAWPCASGSVRRSRLAVPSLSFTLNDMILTLLLRAQMAINLGSDSTFLGADNSIYLCGLEPKRDNLGQYAE